MTAAAGDSNRSQVIRVSIIIPTFNDQAGVDVCLGAIANQNFSQGLIEVIVVDNGSEPPLVITGKYPFAIRLVLCTRPGSYAARNAGVSAATGSILAFIDADCWPDPEWLVVGVRSLMAGNGHSIIGGEVSFSAPEKTTAVALYQIATGFGQEENVRDKGFAATANLLCMREQFEAIGPFDDRLLSGGDREWCWRAAKRGLPVRFEPNAKIFTEPRSSLRSAIRQARRVVAGRDMLRTLGLAHLGPAAVAKQRTTLQAVAWILTNHKLGWVDRLRVLVVATVIRGVAVLEGFRLAMGGMAERR